MTPPFYKETEKGVQPNWMRLAELALIVAFNVGALISVMKMQINDLREQFKEFTATVSASQTMQDNRINVLEKETAICLERVETIRHSKPFNR